MDLLDSWAGLNAPTRGVPMAPRHLPDVVLARDLERPTAAGQPDRSDLRRLRRGVLAPLPDVHASPSARAVHEVLLHARAFQLT